MSTRTKNVSRTLTLNQGGVARQTRGLEAKAKVNRELHGVAIAIGEVKGRIPEEHAEWFYDLRRKQNRVYGGLLRFIDTAASTNTPRAVIDQIPGLIASYIEDVYESVPKRAA